MVLAELSGSKFKVAVLRFQFLTLTLKPIRRGNLLSQNWIERANKVVMHTYGRQPLVLVKGEGCRVWDDAGREYLDFVSGLAVVNLGHAHPDVTKAAAAQLTQLVHVSNIYYTTPMVELAETLVGLSFADRVFFANSGAEVNEGAIKLARRYSRERFGEGRHRIICTENSFHGRTFGALSATGQSKFWQGFEPLLPGFSFVPFNDLEAVARAVDDTVCAVILEPIQGEGGVNLPSPDYFTGLRQLCDDKKLLLILDEIQTGLGRTGKLFAHENFGITPDIMTLAKGLANGLPMGALLATEKVASAFVPGTHASTFGAGPVVAAAAKTVLDLLSRPAFLAGVRERGNFLQEKLIDLQSRFAVIKEVRGLGLMWGLELDQDGAPVVNACRERGLLVNCTQGNVIRLLPPLIVRADELNQGLGILAEALALL
jgi:acetylornithine/N-succinyldiaminopimelate aminotransferase